MILVVGEEGIIVRIFGLGLRVALLVGIELWYLLHTKKRTELAHDDGVSLALLILHSKVND